MSLQIVILCVLALLVGVPLLTLVHELGHALAAAVLIGGRIVVLQGPEPRRLDLRLGRLDLRLHGVPAPHRGWVGWAQWEAHPSRRRHALVLAAGPVASLAAAVTCALATAATRGAPRVVLLVLALDAVLQAASSAVPVRYPGFAGSYAGRASDGGQIRWLLASRPAPSPALRVAEHADPSPRAAPAPDPLATASPAAAGGVPEGAAARS